jgi:hypothetical protein
MKALPLLIIILYLSSAHSNGQSLEGRWKGGYYMGDYRYQPVPFSLDISINKDGSYKIYSTTIIREERDTLVADVKYRLAGSDSVYLEELQVKKLKKDQSCPQKISLARKIRDGKATLEGIWMTPEAFVSGCGRSAGTVLLTKEE